MSFIDGHTFANLGSFSVIPDLQQVFASWGPVQWANYAVATADEATVDPSVGGTQYIDDMSVSPDGTVLYVSRANLDDVAAFNLVTHQELWRSAVDGIHADHMAVSPDGTRVVVSATTAQVADVYNAQTGARVATFPTGTYPHQSLCLGRHRPPWKRQRPSPIDPRRASVCPALARAACLAPVRRNGKGSSANLTA